MAKRKAPSKSTPAAAAAAAAAKAEVEQQQQQQEEKAPETTQQQQQEEQPKVKVEDPKKEDPAVEEEVEEEEGEEEDEAQEDSKDEDAPTQTTNEDNEEDNEEDDDEPVQKLLEPFTKDQLIELLREASEKHGDVLENIRKLSDTDPVHRKIFVHGLGWDSNSEILIDVFKKYGEIEDCKAVIDKLTGKSKGYAFILFKSRIGARKALKEPQKKIGSRMTSCQLASAGPVPAQAHVHSQQAAAVVNPSVHVSEYTQRKIYVSNVAAEIDPQKLVSFFSKFGEIEEGPLGLDKDTGKPRGFALFVYKSIESAKKALEEPHKTFEGHVLHCQRAIDGPKPNKQQFLQQQTPVGGRPAKFARTDNSSFGGHSSGVTGGHLMAQSGPVPYNQGASQALNPVLGQALTALLASQGGGGLGLNNILAPFGSTGVGAAGNPAGGPLLNSAMQGGYGNQHMGSGYGSQPGMQGGYSNYQMGQGAGRLHKGGYTGGANPYMGR